MTASGKLKWLQGYSRPELREHGDIVWHGRISDNNGFIEVIMNHRNNFYYQEILDLIAEIEL